MLGRHPVAVLLNANARQFSERVLKKIGGVIPRRDIYVSRTAAEARAAAQAVLAQGYPMVCTGGGDGTLVHFVTSAYEILGREGNAATPDIAHDMTGPYFDASSEAIITGPNQVLVFPRMPNFGTSALVDEFATRVALLKNEVYFAADANDGKGIELWKLSDPKATDTPPPTTVPATQ